MKNMSIVFKILGPVHEKSKKKSNNDVVIGQLSLFFLVSAFTLVTKMSKTIQQKCCNFF